MTSSLHLLSKRLTVGFVGLGAVVALTACGSQTDTATAPVEEDATTEESEMTESETTADGSMSEDMGGTIVDVAASDESFSTLVQAIEAAGLAETLAAEGPYTVFAPTNDAFAALPDGTLDQLLLPENQDLLIQVLTYHVVPAEVASADITAGPVATVEGSEVTLAVDEATGSVMVNEATVLIPDVQASNGVIHAIDQVLLPPDA
ncbi:MAG: fasciclin domain-containing protein [Elainellaceae cyanobacterium]